MKLTKLAAKPQLVKIELIDEDIVKEYGEPLEFHIWDRQPIDKYIKIASVQGENVGELIKMVNEMILDEEGNKILNDDVMLPNSVMTRVIAKVVETLGK